MGKFRHDSKKILPGIPDMKNRRFCGFDSRLDLTSHALYLNRMWLSVPEIVKPDFTDRNNPPAGCNFLQLLESAGIRAKGSVRMNPGRGVYAFVAPGYFGRLAAGFNIDAYRHDSGDPGLQRPLEDGRDGAGEFREIQVSVCVDQFRKIFHMFATFGLENR